LAYNTVLQTYYTKDFQRKGFLKNSKIIEHAKGLIERFDIRSGQGAETPARSMSGGNQQKVILSREIDRDPKLLIAVQPTRGLDVGAIEYIHQQLLEQRDSGSAVLLMSLELEEVMNVSDRILVMYEGEIVADVRPENVTFQELGLYMSGAKRDKVVA
jgi:simple sugar transport system ATP-binding protein